MVIRRRMKISKKYNEKWELKMKRIDSENKRLGEMRTKDEENRKWELKLRRNEN